MGNFYDINSANISHREYWWGTRSPAVLAGWLTKWLRMRLPSSTDDPNVENLAPFESDESGVPRDAAARIAPLCAELEALGFHSPRWHVVEDHETHTLIVMATYLHESGALGRAFHRYWSMTHPPKCYLAPQFITAFEDGTFLVSSALKADMAAPPECPVSRREGASAAELWESHQEALTRPPFDRPAFVIETNEDSRSAAEQCHALHRDFHLRRGVFVPRAAELENQPVPHVLPAASIAAAAPADGSPPPLPEEQYAQQHPEIHAEMARIQNATGGGWGKTLLTLGITAALFVGLGATVWEWNFVLWLIPILLVHELGHFVAMKFFRYRNLKMFFIPLLGAAVSGRHYNVAGWKKVIVSLMGPVPGVVLGGVLGAVGIATGQDWLLNAAFLTIILNGFNLLPVLPLDGGWVVHSILFSRHYLMDVGFRILAGLALLGGFIALDDRILMFLGIFMLFGIPANLKLARVAHTVRNSGLPTISPDNESVPPETTDRIIGLVKEAFPKGLTAKNIAQMTLGIFESLNARPPGWVASIGLLGVYAGSFVMAVVLAILLVVERGGGLGEMLRMAVAMPQLEYECGADRAWQGSEFAATAAGESLTLVASYEDADMAARQFEHLSRQLPVSASARVFGQSLLVALPAGDDDLRAATMDAFGAEATNTFAATTNFYWTASISFVAPDTNVAARIEQALLGLTQTPGAVNLIPPWHPADQRSLSERQQHERARHTFRELNQRRYQYLSNEEYQAGERRLNAAQRRGDNAAVATARHEQELLAQRLQHDTYAELRDAGPDIHDQDLITRFQELPRPDEDFFAYQTAFEQLAEGMGRLADLPGGATTENERQVAEVGFVHRNGLVVQIQSLTFADPFYGMPSLASWLCLQECTSIKYDFQTGAEWDGLFEE